MNKNIIFASLFCVLFNSSTAMANIELPTQKRHLPGVQTCTYELLEQTGSLINSVKNLVMENISLFPEFKPAGKPHNNNETNTSSIFSIFKAPQKPGNTINKSAITGQWLIASRSQLTQCITFQSNAPPGRGIFIYIFLLVYFILLKKSNLPWRTALSCKIYSPDYAA